MTTAESEARRALNRLRRATEKVEREMDTLRGALVHAEGDDFPHEVYDEITDAIRRVLDFTDDEAARLQEKILHAGGLEPGRVRRG
jgi:Mg2+ and Co2+ transporter CorA